MTLSQILEQMKKALISHDYTEQAHADIIEVISELHARGHKCDFTAIDARFSYDYLDLVAILKELCFLGVLELYGGEFFVILPQEF